MSINQKGFTLIEGLLIVMVLAVVGFGGYYVFSQQTDDAKLETSSISEIETEESAGRTETEDFTYESILYPDLSFIVPEGWDVDEPDDYDKSNLGEGSANGLISVSNGDAILKLDLVTILATGFAGYNCSTQDGLTAVGEVYRFVGDEGQIIYADGISEVDDEWTEVIADEGNFTNFEDPEPNYCVSFPFLGTYSSTINQLDFPEQPYGLADQQKAIAWLSGSIEGAVTEQQLSEADSIIKSLSQPDLGY